MTPYEYCFCESYLGMIRKIAEVAYRNVHTSVYVRSPRRGWQRLETGAEKQHMIADQPTQSSSISSEIESDFKHEIFQRPDRRSSSRKSARNAEFEEALIQEFEGHEREIPIESKMLKTQGPKEFFRRENIKKFDMARRKYYDFPVEDNLLSWQAKLQIRELWESEPDVWTAENIAKSFPVSAEAARRFLKSKWPPENMDDSEIEKHDEDVRRRWTLLKNDQIEEGLLSELTLRMIRTGQVKFLPMFALGNKNASVGENVETDKSVIVAGDGPFVKLYKRHLQSLKMEQSTADKAKLRLESEPAGEVLRMFVFPEENPEVQDVPVKLGDFRHHLKKALGQRNRPEDRRFQKWMRERERVDGKRSEE